MAELSGKIVQVFRTGDFTIWDGRQRWTCHSDQCAISADVTPAPGVEVRCEVRDDRVVSVAPYREAPARAGSAAAR